MLPAIFEQFAAESPVSVMARGLMEYIFAPARIDQIFTENARQQYQQELLFSSQVDLMSLVVCGIYPSVHAAYRAKAARLGVSTTTLYNKLQGIELGVSRALVRETAQELSALIQTLQGQQPSPLPGYEVRIVDGNCLAGSDHRLKATRAYAAKVLPGKALVVLDPSLQLALDVLPCEDGHAQERSLFDEVLGLVKAQQVWLADRNFCTLNVWFSLAKQDAFGVIRQHGLLPYQAVSELVYQGTTATGEVFEQALEIRQHEEVLRLRRIVVKLFQPTRDQETELAILTNLPQRIGACQVADLYRQRWQVETLFQSVTVNFNSEIHTLAYPKAALFSFCMALSAYNILATLRAALGSVHGVEKIQAGLSDFYLVDEVQSTYRGMMIAIAPVHWQIFGTLPRSAFAQLLQQLATGVNLKRFMKSPRGVKKKRKPLIVDCKHRHLSTARLLRGDYTTLSK